MPKTLAPGCFLGTRSIERGCAGFVLALRRATVPPEQVSEHAHEGAHLILAIDAGYLSAAARDADPAPPATLVYNPPGTLHRDRFADRGGRFLSIDLPADMAPARVGDAAVVADHAARAAAFRIAGMLADAGADPLDLEDRLLLLAAALDAPRRARHAPGWLARAADALAAMAADGRVQVRDVARAVGVHPVHLARAHRRHFGHGPGEAIRGHRLARAGALLARGRSLADVAHEAGFADQSHMNRAFRHACGTTPARFRDAFA